MHRTILPVIICELIVAFFWTVTFLPGAAIVTQPVPTHQDVNAYVLEKLESHDIVFLGEQHQKTEMLETMAGLIPSLHNAKVTHLALEIASDQQEPLNRYLNTGAGIDRIKLHTQMDCPQYRALFELLRSLEDVRRPTPIAIDLPESKYPDPISRDEYMAHCLVTIFESDPNAKVLALLGNNHILKKLDWQKGVVHMHQSIRHYLSLKKPAVSMFSIAQIAKKSINHCDFYDRLHSDQGAVAVDLDRRFEGWRLGMVSNMAIEPTEIYELLDSVIVY